MNVFTDTEIKGLDNLESIWMINLSHNKITEIKGLKNLITLLELNLSYNQITEFKGIDGLVSLGWVNIWHNPITKIHPIKDVPYLHQITFFDAEAFSDEDIKEMEEWCEREELKLYITGEHDGTVKNPPRFLLKIVSKS